MLGVMEIAMLFLLIIQTLALAGICVVAFLLVNALRSVHQNFSKTVENLSYLSSIARDENIPKRVSGLLTEARETLDEAKQILSSISAYTSAPRVVGRAVGDFIGEGTKSILDKSSNVKNFLSALAYGISLGWRELTKPTPSDGLDGRKQR